MSDILAYESLRLTMYAYRPHMQEHQITILTLYRWLWTKMIRHDSKLDQTLHFLLDHPRRRVHFLVTSRLVLTTRHQMLLLSVCQFHLKPERDLLHADNPNCKASPLTRRGT